MSKPTRISIINEFTFIEVERLLIKHPGAHPIKIDKQIIPLTDAQIFFDRGFNCCNCGIEGDHFKLTKDKRGKIHLDLYSDDHLIVLDFIIPKTHHGPRQPFNLVPVCEHCYTTIHNKIKTDCITPELIDWVDATIGLQVLNQ